MKLTVLFLTVGFLSVTAKGISQNVSFSGRNVPIETVFSAIEKQTDFVFMYIAPVLNNAKPVTVRVTNIPVEKLLSEIFSRQPLDYTIKGKSIFISAKRASIFSDTHTSNVVLEIPKDSLVDIGGQVKDAKGESLVGVNIIVKGTGKGATTNANGEFLLKEVNENAVLIFSFVGFKSKEIKVGGLARINVQLEANENPLDQVIVVGYGSVKNRDIMGSVSKAPVEDMQKAPVVAFDQALAGRVAGVEVRSDDGQPGAAINIVIRGGNSITQSNSPLYVVDDFPIENNDNNAINPADIESIVILKDAAATAIYGSRGANGVILITTKRGKTGEPVIRYDGSYGFQNNTKKIELLSPYEFVKLQLEIDNVNATANYLSNGKSLESYRDVQPIDWYSKIFQNSATFINTLSVSGGTSKSKYAVSGSYTNQDGIILNSGFKRYQGRASLDQTLTSKLKFGISLNYAEYNTYGTIVNTSDQSGVTGPYLYSVWSYRPVEIDGQAFDLEEELFDPNTQTGGGFNDRRVNPIIQAQNELRKSRNTNILTNAYLEYSILAGLKLRITGGYSKALVQDISFNNSKTRTGSPQYPLSLGVNGKNILTENLNYVNENTLTYDKQFSNNHQVNIVAGFSQQKNTTSATGIEAIQLPNESLGISGLEEGIARTITARSSASQLRSVFGRVAYSYKSKYYVQGILRGDGSSKFSSDYQWAYFPSLGVKYAIIEEDFMKKYNFVSDAKVRASFGYSGNNRVSDYAYLTSIGFPVSLAYSWGNTTPVYGAAPTGIGNPNLKWETTRSFDVGVDLGFIDNRIMLTMDYYYKTTEDLLLNAQIPGTSGYTTAFKNIGSVANKGFEFTLNTVNIAKKDFQWNTNFNISFNRNKILSLTEGQESLVSTSSGPFANVPKGIAKIGQPIALFYGAIFDGLYPYEDFHQLSNGSYVLKDDVPSNGTTRSGIQPGHAKYKDLNNDGIVNTDDFTVIGNPNADFVGGFNNNFMYKGFDLNVFFRFSYGNDVLNANRIIFEGRDNYTFNTNMYATYANRWSATNTNTDIPNRAGRGPQYWSTAIVEDASMVRLAVLSVGYTFTGKLIKKANIKSIRLNFAANNLYTWTNYSGLDPEVSVRGTNLTPSMDYSAYPRARTLTFGLNVVF